MGSVLTRCVLTAHFVRTESILLKL